jgi:hypothetical protein
MLHLGSPVPGFLVGIADGSVTVKSYWIPVMLGVAVAARSYGLRLRAYVVAPVIALGVLAAFFWDMDSAAWAGIAHLCISVGATSLGGVFFVECERDPKFVRFILWCLVLWAVFESVICVLQVVGVGIFPMDAASELYEGGRSNGTFGHPSTLGKVCVMLLAFILPFSASLDADLRRMSAIATAAMIPGLIATSSRTNFAAFLIVVLTWTMISTSPNVRSRRFWVILASIVLVASTYSVWIWRFRTGEDGTAREALLATGLSVVRMNPWVGTGPNRYLLVASGLDPLAALGWPVHNVFIFAAAELGLICATLLTVPFVWLCLRSFQVRRSGGLDGSTLCAYFSVLLGVMMIGMTGWGLLIDTLPVLFVVFGFAVSAYRNVGSEMERRNYECTRRDVFGES